MALARGLVLNYFGDEEEREAITGEIERELQSPMLVRPTAGLLSIKHYKSAQGFSKHAGGAVPEPSVPHKTIHPEECQHHNATIHE